MTIDGTSTSLEHLIYEHRRRKNPEEGVACPGSLLH